MQHFKNFVHQEGQGVVPQKYVTEDGFKLGGWVQNIRNRKKIIQMKSFNC